MTHEETREAMKGIVDLINMDDERLTSLFYACGEQGRDEDAAPLRREILRRMESRIY